MKQRQRFITHYALKLADHMQTNMADFEGKGKDFRGPFIDLLNERIRLAAFLEGAVLVDIAVDQGGCIEVLPQYRRGISFRTFNLLKPFDGLGRFDVVFCRNVLIYFSQERKRDIVRRVARILNPGGHLFLGSTESMSGYEDRFEMRQIAGGPVYRLRD